MASLSTPPNQPPLLELGIPAPYAAALASCVAVAADPATGEVFGVVDDSTRVVQGRLVLNNRKITLVRVPGPGARGRPYLTARARVDFFESLCVLGSGELILLGAREDDRNKLLMQRLSTDDFKVLTEVAIPVDHDFDSIAECQATLMPFGANRGGVLLFYKVERRLAVMEVRTPQLARVLRCKADTSDSDLESIFNAGPAPGVMYGETTYWESHERRWWIVLVQLPKELIALLTPSGDYIPPSNPKQIKDVFLDDLTMTILTPRRYRDREREEEWHQHALLTGHLTPTGRRVQAAVRWIRDMAVRLEEVEMDAATGAVYHPLTADWSARVEMVEGTTGMIEWLCWVTPGVLLIRYTLTNPPERGQSESYRWGHVVALATGVRLTWSPAAYGWLPVDLRRRVRAVLMLSVSMRGGMTGGKRGVTTGGGAPGGEERDWALLPWDLVDLILAVVVANDWPEGHYFSP